MDSPSHTVLVVDDDASIRFLCRVNLELDGWTVRDEATIEGARRELEHGGVDLVLLDLHLGHERSVDFLAELREHHPGLPVVFLTGSVGTSALEGVQSDGVIAKPFTLANLTETVRAVAARVPQRAG